MESVVIVVPIYKEKMSLSERISLSRLYKILGKYPITYIAPEKMRKFLIEKGVRVEIFSNESFENVESYSKLLLTPSFYNRFIEYKYMLIYQLDAFVFYDNLKEWCEKNYDFIGAPMPRIWWNSLTAHTWNGGLSLRKISKCMYVTNMRNDIFLSTGMKEAFEKAEDAFFSYCGEREDIDFKVPTFSVGKSFSLQANVGHCYDGITTNNLPFACHGWTKQHYFPFWCKFIEYYSGSLEKVKEEIYKIQGWTYDETRRICIDYYYLMPRIMRGGVGRARDVFLQLYPLNSKYALWGYGFWGKDALKFFRYIHINVAYIFDANINNNMDCGITIRRPDLALIKLKGCKIIITTERFEKEIAEKLDSIDLIKGRDYWGYLDFKRRYINEYYKDSCKKMFCQDK